MGYGLGVDLGTTYTAAAVRRAAGVEVLRLGARRAEAPSVVFVTAEATVLVGEPAARRGETQPGRMAREFKRRVGDPVPLLVGGTPYSAHALMARQLEHVLRAAETSEGAPPEAVVVTCPANWGPYKRDLLAQATRLADLDAVELRTEPEAAAVQFASGERVSPGEIIAVYDLGGGTFDAAVLRRTDDGFELLGEPEGIEQLGGIDFDEAVFEHAFDTVRSAVSTLAPDDPDVRAALARLRRDCVEAKEALSEDTEVLIPVALPGLHTRIRLTRAEFESMIAPALSDTVGALRRALRSAGVQPAALRAVLLSGGSSRIPLVSSLVGTAFDRPVVLDPDPEHSIALGAARLAVARPAGAAGAAHPWAGRATVPVVPARSPTPPPTFPTPGVPTPGVPTSGVPTSGVPTSGVPTSGVPTSGVPTSGVPTSGVPTPGIPTPRVPTSTTSASGVAAPGFPAPVAASHSTAALPTVPLHGLTEATAVETAISDEPPTAGTAPSGRRLRILVAAAAVLVIAVAVPVTLRLLPIGDGKDTPPAAPPSSVAAAACGFTDDFDGTTLDAAWELNRTDLRITVADGVAEVDAPDGTDIYHANMTAPMLLRPITGDFVLEAALEVTPAVFYQAAGLLLWDTQTSYVRMERGFGGGFGTMALEYNDGGTHTRVHGPLPSQKPVHTTATRVVMRLARAGDQITSTWRPADSADWSELGTIKMHLPDTVRVGVSALNRAQFGAKPIPFQARFDRVSVTC